MTEQYGDELPQTLSLAVKLASFCYCPKSFKGAGQYTWNQDGSRMVCCCCFKPAAATGIKYCAACNDEYIDFTVSRWRVLGDGRVIDRITYCEFCG